MVTESGEQFQTLFDEKRLYRPLNFHEQKNGIFIFRAQLIRKEERGTSDEEHERARNERLRKKRKERLGGDLQLNSYILLGWHQGRTKMGSCTSWNKSEKYGWTNDPGLAAYYPIEGSRWVYIWKTHARYAAHPDPIWENERWTHFVEIDKTPQRITTEKMLALLSMPKPLYEGPCNQKDVWIGRRPPLASR
jgi:hypothetical protein